MVSQGNNSLSGIEVSFIRLPTQTVTKQDERTDTNKIHGVLLLPISQSMLDNSDMTSRHSHTLATLTNSEVANVPQIESQ
eukprot:5820948-Amphidinium_carterae.1